MKNKININDNDEIFHVFENLLNLINNNSNDNELRHFTSTINLMENLIPLVVNNCKNDETFKSEEINCKCLIFGILKSLEELLTFDDTNQSQRENFFYEQFLTIFKEVSSFLSVVFLVFVIIYL